MRSKQFLDMVLSEEVGLLFAESHDVTRSTLVVLIQSPEWKNVSYSPFSSLLV
jgi:hypothetical protein